MIGRRVLYSRLEFTIMLYKSFLVLAILGVLIDSSMSDNKEKKKLQIGIKKRVENCTIKSKKGDLLHVNYKGMLSNGKEFDSNRKDQPFTFTLGAGQVIKGWDQGLMGMCVGELRKLVIPPELAYGKNGIPPKIPKDSTLIFHIDLTEIEHKDKI